MSWALLIACCVVTSTAAWDVVRGSNTTNVCLSTQAKPDPTPEHLTGLLEGWKEMSCCTPTSSNRSSLPTRPLDNCSNWIQPDTKECREYFIRNDYFFDCSPNLGPWIDKQNATLLHPVPVCPSECTSWFEKCSNVSTCPTWVPTDNCTANDCVLFQNRFKTASEFCLAMDDRWKISTKETLCLKPFFFNGTFGTNPNDAVALHYSGNSAPALFPTFWIFLIFIIFSPRYKLQ